ncbi:MAG: flavodoxin, partial [Anaerolineaceae bacterium]|nr:flavodoxin [Anaerolineaceae bacterium]
MTKKSYTRREFLKVSGVVVTAGSLTCCGFGALASRSPKVETPELNYGKESNMSNRILVAYATKAGSTAEIAAKIGEHLSARGFSVDVINVKSKPDPKDYQAVILGSCIRMG